MIFSSILFLFRFLPIFLLLYFGAPKRVKNFILFFASLIFYAWGEPIYVVLLLFSTISDYGHGRAMERYPRYKKVLLCSSIIINLALLGYFKYAGFVVTSLNAGFDLSIPVPNLPLPLGISFYTFQTMSYTIDVYRGKVKAQKNILDFGVFVALFPQLVAGPIVQYSQVEKELKNRQVTTTNLKEGIERFILGLGKKVLLANNIGILWDQISVMNHTELSVLGAWMGIIAYGFQIYFDFSGYSDMAIGLGKMMGFQFPENFNYPYMATSITDFWRRWHMTLSGWLRDYVYIPLGGNRKGFKRQIFNIFVVWALTGIWHGAGWNFLFWGLWFAVFLIAEKLILGKRSLPYGLSHVYTLVVVALGWVWFSLESLERITGYLGSMFGVLGNPILNNQTIYMWNSYGILFVVLTLGATCYPKKIAIKIQEKVKGNILLNMAFYTVIFFVAVAYIVEASYNPFLYFRF